MESQKERKKKREKEQSCIEVVLGLSISIWKYTIPMYLFIFVWKRFVFWVLLQTEIKLDSMRLSANRTRQVLVILSRFGNTQRYQQPNKKETIRELQTITNTRGSKPYSQLPWRNGSNYILPGVVGCFFFVSFLFKQNQIPFSDIKILEIIKHSVGTANMELYFL